MVSNGRRTTRSLVEGLWVAIETRLSEAQRDDKTAKGPRRRDFLEAKLAAEEAGLADYTPERATSWLAPSSGHAPAAGRTSTQASRCHAPETFGRLLAVAPRIGAALPLQLPRSIRTELTIRWISARSCAGVFSQYVASITRRNPWMSRIHSSSTWPGPWW